MSPARPYGMEGEHSFCYLEERAHRVGTLTLANYRKQWPRIGAVLAMALGGTAALSSRKLTKLQLLSLANFIALLVHQYEEYQDPGWFPGQFNGGLFKSDTPQNYPLNTHSAMCINTVVGYPFYIAPILAPKVKWLGLGPVLFGMGQAVGHGIIFPRMAGDKYSPGFLASILLHVPIGITYIRVLREGGQLTGSDWRKGVAYQVAIAALGVAAPNALLRDRHSPYAFTDAQVGPHGAVTV